MTPRVVFGMTLYNNARHLREAMDSLLAQSDPEFGLVVLDDGSTDEGAAIADEYAARDPRVHVARHPRRRGMVEAWRGAYALARQRFPSMQYFAWASDHDRWHRDWLRRTRETLDAHPGAVLAYSQTLRIDETGALLEKQPKTFDTAGVRSPAERFLHFAREAAGAGDLVYGLMRADALERAGIFRPVLLPDRLLMAEMALQGEFRQVPDVLWFRRQSSAASVPRQRTSLFVDDNRPARLWRAPWLQHAEVLRGEYVRAVRPEISPREMRPLIRAYQLHYLRRQYSKSTAVLHRLDNGREAAARGVKYVRRAGWVAFYEGRMAAAAWRGRMNRRGRRALYDALVLRRRLRAAAYETAMATRARVSRGRRVLRKALHHALVLTHRLGLRGRT